MSFGTLRHVLLPKVLGWSDYSRLGLSNRRIVVAPLVAAGLSLILYASTMARDLTWSHYGGDGGELITASMTLGIPHPPGYPLYTLIGRLFGAIPLGQVAVRYSFLSALSAAMVVGVVVLLITIRNSSETLYSSGAVAVGLSLAFTPLFWSQAIIVEVYALFTLFMSLFLWALLTSRSAFLIGLLFGLTVTSHLTGLLLLPLALWRVAKTNLVRFGLGSALGLSPFLLLPLLSSGDSPVNWGEMDSIRGWWWFVSARLYRPNVFSLPVNQWPQRIVNWLEPFTLLPAILWTLLAVLAIVRARLRIVKFSVALMLTALLYFLYALTYRTQDAAVYLLPGLILLAVVAGRGLVRSYPVALWLLPAAMLALSMAHWLDAGRQEPVRELVATAMTEVPVNSIVLTPGDETISALWYFQHVERVRPDIVIMDENMFQFDWYRADLRLANPGLWMPLEDDLALFIAENQHVRPVCSLSLSDGSMPSCLATNQEASVE